MATHITKNDAWSYPPKYGITLDAEFEVISVVNQIATIRIVGEYIIDQSEHDSEMVAYPASDYGFLFEGRVVPAAPTTVIPGTHYMEALPTLFGGSAEQYANKMLLEFRGDSYQADGGNFTNLWLKGDGLVINRKFGNTSTTVPLDITINVDVSAGGNSPVLSWVTTYVTFVPTVEYRWGASVVWVSFIDLDYRPGTTFKSDNPYMPGNQSGLWLSHNRTNKAAHVLADVENITWQEMRTIRGDSGGQGDPPLILHQADANSWYNQKLLGKD